MFICAIYEKKHHIGNVAGTFDQINAFFSNIKKNAIFNAELIGVDGRIIKTC